MSDPVRELAEYLVGNPIPSMQEEALNELEYMIRRAIEHVIETRERDRALMGARY